MTIFIAVLIFTGMRETVEVFTDPLPFACRLVVAYGLFLALYLAMLVTIEGSSRGWSQQDATDLEESFWVIADTIRADCGERVQEDQITQRSATKKNVASIEGSEVFVRRLAVARTDRLRSVKCWSSLFAFMTGFAAINAGGVLQQHDFFASSPMAALVPVFLNQIILFIVFLVSQQVLDSAANAPKADGDRHGWRMTLFRQELRRSETHVAALSLSFLAVQVLRFQLTGDLPQKEGLDRNTMPHSWYSVLGLSACCIVFAAFNVILAIRVGQQAPAAGLLVQGSGGHVQDGGCQLFRMVLDVCDEVEAFRLDRALGPMLAPSLDPGSVAGRVVIAIVISCGSFVLIFVLDSIEDRWADEGPLVGEVLQSGFTSLGLLVGFSWESCLDTCVTATASLMPSPEATKLLLAAVVASLVIPAWKNYVHGKVLSLQQMHEEHKQVQSGESYDFDWRPQENVVSALAPALEAGLGRRDIGYAAMRATPRGLPLEEASPRPTSPSARMRARPETQGLEVRHLASPPQSKLEVVEGRKSWRSCSNVIPPSSRMRGCMDLLDGTTEKKKAAKIRPLDPTPGPDSIGPLEVEARPEQSTTLPTPSLAGPLEVVEPSPPPREDPPEEAGRYEDRDDRQ
eukprot:CAMPEP_0180820580 /NCGR_PEP_ID=MMETSP1038_2-20121128/70362_1 /TAXON_ID=632150 /ORGANISM="Azadinium spinosum, Strain 3D9" /LENGTH=627 /DNA_ID=CAMNT_0022862683 /DNA_START=83 /DNA_END=1968 /DNA_ORIENTATION=-